MLHFYIKSFGEMFNQKIMEYTDDIGVIAGWSRHSTILYRTAVFKRLGI